MSQVDSAFTCEPLEMRAAPVEWLSHSLNTVALGKVTTAIFQFDGTPSTQVVAVIVGDVTSSSPLVRVHSRCLYGEVLGSLDCDCLGQLNLAWERIRDEGCGVLVYLEQEGRGCGLFNKARAYQLQQSAGLDTVEAYESLALPTDARHYDKAAVVLTELGVSQMRLMTNNPLKTAGLEGSGLKVERVPHRIVPTRWNIDYLRVKQEKLGHDLGVSPEDGEMGDDES